MCIVGFGSVLLEEHQEAGRGASPWCNLTLLCLKPPFFRYLRYSRTLR